MERVLKRIFYLVDIYGNKKTITKSVLHMSDPSRNQRGPELGMESSLSQPLVA